MVDKADTIEDWVVLVRRYRASARLLLSKKMTSNAWNDAGFAVECALKAAIMNRHRFNRWPSKDQRPDLYSHHLHHLMKEAGINLQASDALLPKWQTVLLWDRSDTYGSRSMPFKVATDMYEAACGQHGVIEWMNTNFRLDI